MQKTYNNLMKMKMKKNKPRKYKVAQYRTDVSQYEVQRMAGEKWVTLYFAINLKDAKRELRLMIASGFGILWVRIKKETIITAYN